MSLNSHFLTLVKKIPPDISATLLPYYLILFENRVIRLVLRLNFHSTKVQHNRIIKL